MRACIAIAEKSDLKSDIFAQELFYEAESRLCTYSARHLAFLERNIDTLQTAADCTINTCLEQVKNRI